MKKGQPNKFEQSLKELQYALSFEEKAGSDAFFFAGIAKCFETALEYGWKELKQRVEKEGLDVLSPKDAIRKAGEIGMINSVEAWIGFLDARNIAVHDYLGVPRPEYLVVAKEFLIEAKKLGSKK